MLDPKRRFDHWADQYNKCKAVKDELKNKHKKELEKVDEILERIKGELSEALTSIGVENVKTVHGTIHFIRRRSVTLTDSEAFMDYVIKNEAWELLDRKANSTAVQDFIKENGSEPPGARINTFTDVSVRRGDGKSE